jgi:RNA recognition motif-containing protein
VAEAKELRIDIPDERPKRRMGFVGFKSHEAAQQAVKHFNKTYMKMSKIAVDRRTPSYVWVGHEHR